MAPHSMGKINADVNFLNYTNYKNFVDFIMKSESLKLMYSIPYADVVKTFYRDVDVETLSKSELKPNGVITETISLNCKSLWYEKQAQQYVISSEANEVRWDFRFDSYWSGYTVRDLDFINTGHVEASVEITVDGEVLKPSIELYIENELYQTITINDTIEDFQKLIYSSKEGEFEIKKELADGTYENLFTLDYIDFENDNVLRLPPNKDCTIKITSDEDIERATITIYVYYVSV